MKRITAPLSVFVLLLAIYLWTMAPGNFWIDSAAFTTCNEILGLPHSPSFPVYTVMGRTLHVMIPASPATASNLYSALTAAAAGVVFYLILSVLLARVVRSESLRRICSISGTLFAFLTVSVWQSAVRAEVYALQLLLSLLIVYLFLKSVNSEDIGSKLRYALGAIFLQGLSFANHSLLALTTIPIVLSLPFWIGWRVIRYCPVRLVLSAVLIFCIAGSFYLYLPIRSGQNPAVNSGNPKTLGATVQAITRSGEDYLTVGGSRSVDYPGRVSNLARFIFDQTGGLILLGVLTGLIFTIREKNKMLLLLAALIPIGLAMTIWAADFRLLNFDIVAYCALPLALLSLLAFHGLGRLARMVSERAKAGRFVVPAIFILAVFFQLSNNLYAGDLSATVGPDRTAEMILDEAPPNAVLILNEDNVLLPLWYQCYALGLRPDLAVVSAGALYRPAYRDNLRQLYPELHFPEAFNVYRIENLGEAVAAFCELNLPRRPIMVQFGVPGISGKNLNPGGFLFRYIGTDTTIDVVTSYPTVASLNHIAGGATDPLTRDFVGRTAFNYGVYFDRIGRTETAAEFFRYAIEIDDENPDYFLRLGVAFLKAGRRAEAVMLLKQAVNTGDGCPEAEDILSRINEGNYSKT